MNARYQGHSVGRGKQRLAVVALLLVACRTALDDAPPSIPDIEIIGRDYAFAAPSQVAAGPAAFRFTNKGKVIHELQVALLKAGTTAADVMSAVNTRSPFKPLIETSVGILIALPNHRSSTGLSTELLADRDYLVICRMRDSASAPMHARIGMISVIHVSPSRDGATPTGHVDTIVAMDYAFRVPPTVAPGRHTLTFVNSGKQQHEVNFALLRPGVTLDQAVKIAKANGDLRGSVEEWLGVLFAGPGTSAPGRLEVMLLSGREYMIKCDLADSDSSPPHITLGMFGSIKTTR